MACHVNQKATQETSDERRQEGPARAVLRAIERIAADVLDPRVPDGPLLDEELREMGLDRRRGRPPRRTDLAEKLLAERREAIRSRKEAIAHAAPLARRASKPRGESPRRTRQEMLDRIARAEADPRFTARAEIAVAAARGRLPEEPTDEELAAM